MSQEIQELIINEIKQTLQSEYYVQQDLSEEQIKDVIKSKISSIPKMIWHNLY